MTTYKNFHAGEAHMQSRWGIDTAAYDAQSNQMMLPDVNPNEHVFIDSVTYSMAGSVDADGRPWASPLLSTGDGLFTVETSRTVRVREQHSIGDPLYDNLAATGQMGVVYFEHATRRRAKSIGKAAINADGSLTYEMTRLFGICPKYIFKRIHTPARELTTGTPEQRATLDDTDLAQLERSDTIWFGSYGPHGADVTHRGGNPGFITVVDDRTLVIPDYFGNGMFNTLGNLVLDSRLAITDVDYATGRTVHMTGTATVTPTGLPAPQPQRNVHMTIDEVRTSFAPMGAWTDVETSRYSPIIAR